MLSSGTILTATLPVFATIALGVVLRRRGVFDGKAEQALITLTMSITYPCFILRLLARNDSLKDPASLTLPALVGFFSVALGIGISYWVGKLIGLGRGTGQRTFALATAVPNYGYLPIPIMEVLWPDRHWAGILFLFSLGIELALWSLGVMMLAGDVRSGLKRMLNPVVGAIIVGAAIGATGLGHYLPDWTLKALDLPGSCAIPIGLIMAGVTIADLLKTPGWLSHWPTIIGGVVMRLVIFAAGLLAVAKWVAPSPIFKEVLAVQAAMPAAVFPLVMARWYGGHEATAMRVILCSTFVSLFTIPWLLPIFIKWVLG